MGKEFMKRQIGVRYDVWQTNKVNAWGNGSRTGWKVTLHGGLTSSLMGGEWKLRGIIKIKSIK